jgi:DNA-binding MarR family transcriptional regulator
MSDRPRTHAPPHPDTGPRPSHPDADLAPQCEMMRSVYILCHMMMRVFDRVVEPEGLTGSRWHLLVVVRDSGQPLTITQLSEALFISPQNVSRMVAALEADGLVTRDTTGPGRTVRIALSPLGQARVERCAQLAEGIGDRMLLGVDNATLLQTTRTLQAMIANTAIIEREVTAQPARDILRPEPTA